jgi:hypothetical protein
MRKIYLLTVTFLLMYSSSLFAQQEAQVQSAFIYHFTKYMEWPMTKQSGDFIIAVVGDDPIIAHLNSLAAVKKVGTQTIVVKKYASAVAVKDCHLIFLSAGHYSQMHTCIEKTKEFNALLVTAKVGYGKKGSGINFIIVGGKPKFEISEKAIKASGIKVSAKLVQLGIKVG